MATQNTIFDSEAIHLFGSEGSLALAPVSQSGRFLKQ